MQNPPLPIEPDKSTVSGRQANDTIMIRLSFVGVHLEFHRHSAHTEHATAMA